MNVPTTVENAHPALAPGGVAVITGAASGIGLAAAKKLAQAGMRIVMADLAGARLDSAAADVLAAAGSADRVLARPCDVSNADDLSALADAAYERFGSVSLLMNNAGMGNNPGKPWEGLGDWKKLVEINFWGAVHGVQAFAPRMIAAGQPGLIVNTGSKQGITTPPGNLAYNVSKAALKTYTEGLAHALRNEPDCRVAAHLLIPGFTYTAMTSSAPEKPAGAWTGEQVVDFMLASIGRGDFYILCGDNETSRATDDRRMAWAMGDVIENRPALSRWHPDYKDAFESFLKG